MKSNQRSYLSLLCLLSFQWMIICSCAVAWADTFWSNLKNNKDQKILQIAKKRISIEAAKDKKSIFFKAAIRDLAGLVQSKEIFATVFLEIIKVVDPEVFLQSDNMTYFNQISIRLREVGSYKTLRDILIETRKRLSMNKSSEIYRLVSQSLALNLYYLHQFSEAQVVFKEVISLEQKDLIEEKIYFAKVRYAEFLLNIGDLAQASKIVDELKVTQESQKLHQALWLKVLEARALCLAGNDAEVAKKSMSILQAVIKKMDTDSLIDYQAYVFLDAAYYARRIGDSKSANLYIEKAIGSFEQVQRKTIVAKFIFEHGRFKNKITFKDKSFNSDINRMRTIIKNTEIESYYEPIIKFYERVVSEQMPIVDVEVDLSKLFSKESAEYKDILSAIKKYKE